MKDEPVTFFRARHQRLHLAQLLRIELTQLEDRAIVQRPHNIVPGGPITGIWRLTLVIEEDLDVFIFVVEYIWWSLRVRSGCMADEMVASLSVNPALESRRDERYAAPQQGTVQPASDTAPRYTAPF